MTLIHHLSFLSQMGESSTCSSEAELRQALEDCRRCAGIGLLMCVVARIQGVSCVLALEGTHQAMELLVSRPE